MNHHKVYYLCICVLVITIIIRGYFALHNPAQFNLDAQAGKTAIISGTIVDEPQMRDFGQIFTIQTEAGDFIRVGTDRYATYGYGDSVIVTGKLSVPRNFSDGDGRSFDFIDYLAKNSVYYEFVKAQVQVVSAGSFTNVSKILYTIKERFLDNLGKVLGEPQAALAAGIVVGEKAALGKDLVDDFRRSGLIHIVILSGYSISIIAGMMRRMLFFLPRVPAIICAGIGIILFAILVGAGATVLRASIMALIALSAELLRRDYSALRGLFLAAGLMLVVNPLIGLYDSSFQLSFLATLGLILLSSPIEKRLGFLTEKLGIRRLVASTIAIQIFVSPLIFYLMGDLSAIGIFVNIIVLPFLPITMLLILFCGTLGFVSFFASQIAGWGAHILLSFILGIVQTAAHLPFSVVILPAFSARILWGIYILYGAVYIYCASRKFFSMTSQLRFAKKSST